MTDYTPPLDLFKHRDINGELLRHVRKLEPIEKYLQERATKSEETDEETGEDPEE